MKLCYHAILFIMINGLLLAERANSSNNPQQSDGFDPAIYLKYEDYKWEKLIPELGDLSAEITILHVNPKTGGTQLMIPSPKTIMRQNIGTLLMKRIIVFMVIF